MTALVQEIILLTALLLPAVLLGAWLNAFGAFVAGAVAMYAAWHLYHLISLERRLSSGSVPHQQRPAGLWGPLFESARRATADRERHKRRLRRLLVRFAGITSTLPDALVILDASDRIQWCNRTAGILLGIRWPEHSGQTLTSLVDDPLLSSHVRTGIQSEQVVIAAPSDQAKLLSIDIIALKQGGRRLLIARDTTREYYLDRSRHDFVANASHELRTPLTVIRGAVESLVDDHDRFATARPIQLIGQQVKRLQAIVDDLLTLSRLDFPDQDQASGSPIDIPRMIEGLVAEARVLSDVDQHDFHLHVAPDLWIRGDVQALRSAFSNLIFNAVRHTPPRSRVVVHWSRTSNGAQFAVRDSGEGIAARHIPRLTERFYRVPGNRKAPGTGLGLAIVKHALIRHQALLHISSEVGGGSTFSCRFPLARLIRRDMIET